MQILLLILAGLSLTGIVVGFIFYCIQGSRIKSVYEFRSTALDMASKRSKELIKENSNDFLKPFDLLCEYDSFEQMSKSYMKRNFNDLYPDLEERLNKIGKGVA